MVGTSGDDLKQSEFGGGVLAESFHDTDSLGNGIQCPNCADALAKNGLDVIEGSEGSKLAFVFEGELEGGDFIIGATRKIE